MKKILNVIKKPFKYVLLMLNELKLVEWISARQTVQYTALVLVISIFIGIMIVVFDLGLLKGRGVLFDL